MAREDGRQDTDLKRRLISEGRRFSFIQALRLLRHELLAAMGPGADEYDVQKRIRVRPDLSLSFPETDIISIREISEYPERFLITATFLGLYGASSPLPTFYTEDLLAEQSRDKTASRDFIDIFNARLYTLYFRCWCMYRLFFRLVEECDRDTIERLYSIMGLGGEKLRDVVDNPYEKLRYAGLMTQFPRSAEGLRSLLADVLDDESVQVFQCVERTVEIPREQRFLLGVSGNILGEDACLGIEISEVQGKFRVRVGPLRGEDFNRYMPDTASFQRVKEFVRLYMDQPLEWDLEAVIMPVEAATLNLGDSKWSRLGWNTWLVADGFFPENPAVCFTDQGVQ